MRRLQKKRKRRKIKGQDVSMGQLEVGKRRTDLWKGKRVTRERKKNE